MGRQVDVAVIRAGTAGICVAFIAITADRLINAWVQQRKSKLGLGLISYGLISPFGIFKRLLLLAAGAVVIFGRLLYV